MTRKNALKVLTAIAACLVGRSVIVADEKPKKTPKPILDEHGNAVGYYDALQISDLKQTGVTFDMDDTFNIEVRYKGKTKTIKPQELFDAL